MTESPFASNVTVFRAKTEIVSVVTKSGVVFAQLNGSLVRIENSGDTKAERVLTTSKKCGSFR